MFSRYFTDSHSIKTLPSYLLSSFIFISVIFLLFHISGFERVFEWNKSLRDAATGFAVFSLITYALREKLYSPLWCLSLFPYLTQLVIYAYVLIHANMSWTIDYDLIHPISCFSFTNQPSRHASLPSHKTVQGNGAFPFLSFMELSSRQAFCLLLYIWDTTSYTMTRYARKICCPSCRPTKKKRLNLFQTASDCPSCFLPLSFLCCSYQPLSSAAIKPFPSAGIVTVKCVSYG